MNMQYEWEVFDNPEGLVSIVVRMSSAEARMIAATDLSNQDQPDPTESQATQRLLIEAIRGGLGIQGNS